MCRWLSYFGKSIFLEQLLFEPDYSLIDQSLNARESVTTTNGDGFGVAWFGERTEPGLFREVLPAWNDANLRNLAHHIQSPLFFAHVRASTGTATSRQNCHPFSVRQWLFMHNGQIGEYEKVRRQIDNLLPDDLYSHRKGTTDSEAIFLLMLANGLDENPQAASEKTIRQVVNLMEKADIKEAFRITAAFADGRNLYALRYSNDEKPPTLYYGHNEDGLVVVSEPLDGDTASWNALAPDTMLIARADGERTISGLTI